VGATYVVYRRTHDGRLRWGVRLPVWLPWALMGATLLGMAHLAWRMPEVAALNTLRLRLHAARAQSAMERGELLAVHDKLGSLRRQLDPVASLNGKLSRVTNLDESEARRGSMGSAPLVEGGSGSEKRLVRQLSAMARALVEEVAFQEVRQRQLTSVLHERALEFAARPSLWPVRGAINSDFGSRVMGRSREFHKGLDIGVPIGSPIVAPADGKVASVGYESGYGLVVTLEHRHGVSTVFAHLKSASVEPGDEVARGKLIAHSGMSGRTTGSHLHYEVRLSGQPVDPMNFMLD